MAYPAQTALVMNSRNARAQLQRQRGQWAAIVCGRVQGLCLRRSAARSRQTRRGPRVPPEPFDAQSAAYEPAKLMPPAQLPSCWSSTKLCHIGAGTSRVELRSTGQTLQG